jgi:hypothetical protein
MDSPNKQYSKETLKVRNSKVLRTFIRSSSVLLGLFVVLSYGLAALALFFVDKNGGIDTGELMCLVWWLVVVPLIVLGVYLVLVVMFHKKYCEVSYFKDKRNSLGDENGMSSKVQEQDVGQ